MIKLLQNPSQILTLNTHGKNFKRGGEMVNIDLLLDHSIIVEDDLIKDIVPNSAAHKIIPDEIINLENKVILPGLVECHTHLVFAGSRANEFKMKVAGVNYEDIAIRGGGIVATMNAVRNSSAKELLDLGRKRVIDFIKQGVTSLEIKSGYGLSFEAEVKLLNVINQLKKEFPINIISTFLGAHTFPTEFKSDRRGYIELLINELIPYIAGHNLADACDGFCEKTAFTPDEIEEIFSAAEKHQMKIKLHSEQFNAIGGLQSAMKFNPLSVDHLEVLKNEDIHHFTNSETVAVLLPGVSYFLNFDYAPARRLIDNNAIVALATDFNPGSSHIQNISLIMNLAALKMKMTFEEIISAYTINSAKALNISEQTGSIEPGKFADFAIFDTNDYSDIIYSVGTNLCSMVIKKGNTIYNKPMETYENY
jgi:imidazolonepropionase